MLIQERVQGYSLAAKQIRTEANSQNRHLQSSRTLGNSEWIDQLWKVWEECRNENWDGYGALPVPGESYEFAAQLISSLPPGFPKPEFGAEPDGELTIEWYQSPYRTISISVTRDGYLHYSAIFGQKIHQNGTEAFNGELPSNIITLIKRVYGK